MRGAVDEAALVAALVRLPRLPYGDWINVISALSNKFGADRAHQMLVAAGWQDERAGETLYKCHRAKRGVSLGTVVWLLRQHGIPTNNLYAGSSIGGTRGTARQPPPARATPPPTPPVVDPPLYRHTEETLERAAIMEYEGGLSREEAMRLCGAERVFRLAVCMDSVDSDIDWQRAEYLPLTLSKEGIVDAVVTHGHSFVPALLNGVIRRGDAWVGSELVVVDVDGGLTLDEALAMPETATALFLYTTKRHSAVQNRYRLVFPLSGLYRDKAAYATVASKLSALYGGDKQAAANPTQQFFGNRAAWLWQPTTG